jgi:hypothetical protein
MGDDEKVKFVCPEGHTIEKHPDEIRDARCWCEKCQKVYRFRRVDLR